MDQGSMLIEDPKTYSHWWTIIPVLPESRDHWEYKALKRQWADHTMNCLSKKTGVCRPGSRGFYVEHREDHIMTVLFHIWALFPDCGWVGSLLDLYEIEHGRILRARWSYSWEQKRNGAGRPDICDIVLCYEDERGQGLLVIEAKRAGGALTEKDLNGGSRYLDLPSVRPFERKRCVFLVDSRDEAAARAKLPSGTPIASWQSLGDLQAKLADGLPLTGEITGQIAAFIARHYADLGMDFNDRLSRMVDLSDFTGTEARYEEIRRKKLPSSVERFLLGSEATFCARQGRMPEPPFHWLADEPSFVEIVEQGKGDVGKQTTRDREVPHWRIR